MNQEDIIRMAKESGMYQILDEYANEFGSGMFDITLCDQFPELVEFAKLIAAAEREACATIIQRAGLPSIAAAIRARGKE
jgi:hypothetical protein